MKREHFLKPCPVCNSSGVSHEITLNKIELLHCDECGFVYANQEDTNIKSYNAKFSREAIEAYKEQQTFIDDMWFKIIIK